MRDRGLIWSALLLFLGFLTLPVWHNLSARITAKGPEPALPMREKQCVAPVEYMKTSHMNLLMNWRESTVRQGTRDFTARDGRHFTMSLTATCLGQCHSAKADFCDRCHTYAAVSLPCWDCHQDSKTGIRSAR
jgi:[DsrC]-trisulfide reductase subunit J